MTLPATRDLPLEREGQAGNKQSGLSRPGRAGVTPIKMRYNDGHGTYETKKPFEGEPPDLERRYWVGVANPNVVTLRFYPGRAIEDASQ